MIKKQIIACLQDGRELTLTEIERCVNNDRLGMGEVSKPLILHHLNGLLGSGLIKKLNGKKYKILGVDFNNGDYISADQLDTIVVPRIIAKAGNDEKKIPDDIDTTTIKTNKTSYKPEDLIVVEISGTSMLPTFQDGDLLLFRKFQLGEIPSNNDIILCRLDDGAKVKRVIRIPKGDGTYIGQLLSDNTNDLENKPIDITDDNFNAIGKYISKLG
ncbi:MAG: hypothetical protein JW985_03575 [Alphaproteobacteria bacterium]|nr:hypothetical protein [Alphaproteobacteria bacterium]